MSRYLYHKLLPYQLVSRLRELKHNLPAAKRRRAHEAKKFEEKVAQLNAFYCSLLFPDIEPQVLSGPFSGMRYLPQASGSALMPKLVGTYEQPIHVWIDKIIASSCYQAIIDVGCAEGYYAVGFALKKPDSMIIAIDLNPHALELCQHLAAINQQQSRIQLSNSFNQALLSSVLEAASPLIPQCESHVLVFMDVEGAEEQLLNPQLNPEIVNVDILLELHDCFSPGLTNKIVSYLADTHRIHIIYDYPRSFFADLLPEQIRSRKDDPFLTDEMRSERMSWMFAQKY